LPKERPELALHVNQNHQHQQDQQLQIQVQLQQHQQKQQTATSSHQQQQQSQQQQQQHQGLLSPGLSFAGNGEFFQNGFYALRDSFDASIIKLVRAQLRYRINVTFSKVYYSSFYLYDSTNLNENLSM